MNVPELTEWKKIQVAPLPGFRKNATNIATWQYVLNKASEHEKAAIKFLKYAASREGNIAYAECMKRLPARLDVIREEKFGYPRISGLSGLCESC